MAYFKRLLSLARPWRGRMLLGIGFSFLTLLSNLALLTLSGWFITAMALSGLSLMRIEFFAPAAAIRGLAVLRTLSRYLERITTHDATLGLIASLRLWLYEKLLPLAPARLQMLQNGDLLTRFRTDVETIGNFYIHSLVPVAAGILAACVFLGWLSFYHAPIALLALLCLIINGLIIPLMIEKASAKTGLDLVAKRAKFQTHAVDLVRGLAEWQINQAFEIHKQSLVHQSAQVIATQRKLTVLTFLGQAASGLVLQFTLIFTFILLFAHPVLQAEAGANAVMIFFAIMAGGEIVAGFPAAMTAFAQVKAAAARLFSTLDLEPAVHFPPDDQACALPLTYDIAFHHVRMRYQTGDMVQNNRPVFEDLNFAVAQGKALALKGASGSGKTTIMELLQRFFDYETGDITIGGTTIRAFSDESLRHIITVIDQQTHIFNASLRDNLRMVKVDATDDELWAALKKAELADEIKAMPQKLDTLAGELGQRLSGGQARRLAIARAFLTETPILLLDEPVEGLDWPTRERVLKALGTLMSGKTTLIAAHDPETQALAESVLDLDGLNAFL